MHFAVNFTLKVAYIFVFFAFYVKQVHLKAVLCGVFCFSCIFSPCVATLQFFVTCQAFFANFCVTFCRREDDVFAVFQVRFFDVSALNSAESVLCRVRNVPVNSCKIRHSIKTKHIRQTNGKQIALTGKMAKNAEKNVPKGEK